MQNKQNLRNTIWILLNAKLLGVKIKQILPDGLFWNAPYCFPSVAMHQLQHYCDITSQHYSDVTECSTIATHDAYDAVLAGGIEHLIYQWREFWPPFYRYVVKHTIWCHMYWFKKIQNTSHFQVTWSEDRKWSSDLEGKFQVTWASRWEIKNGPWLTLFILHWIPAVLCPLIGWSISLQLQTNYWLDWAQIWWVNWLLVSPGLINFWSCFAESQLLTPYNFDLIPVGECLKLMVTQSPPMTENWAGPVKFRLGKIKIIIACIRWEILWTFLGD